MSDMTYIDGPSMTVTCSEHDEFNLSGTARKCREYRHTRPDSSSSPLLKALDKALQYVLFRCLAHLLPCFFTASQHLDLLHASILLERFATGSNVPWTAAGTTGATTALVAIAAAEVVEGL